MQMGSAFYHRHNSLLFFAAPTIWGEIRIAAEHNAYFGICGGVLI
jgi:hypothetical protein